MNGTKNGNGQYAHPEALVSTNWVAAHLDNKRVRLIEVSVDTAAYDGGHIPGAIGWSWKEDTQDTVRRDIPDQATYEGLMSAAGITHDTTVVLYGDMNNWFAAYAFWMMVYYGHGDVRLMNGGRKKWLAENRELTTEVPSISATNYTVSNVQAGIRAYRDDVLVHIQQPNAALVDVRSPDEFSGKLLAPANVPQEGSQRGGHIPGASNIPWGKAVDEDGTFKAVDALRELYADEGVTADKEIIAYCRIGERSSHSWFVLKYLLGFETSAIMMAHGPNMGA